MVKTGLHNLLFSTLFMQFFNNIAFILKVNQLLTLEVFVRHVLSKLDILLPSSLHLPEDLLPPSWERLHSEWVIRISNTELSSISIYIIKNLLSYNWCLYLSIRFHSCFQFSKLLVKMGERFFCVIQVPLKLPYRIINVNRYHIYPIQFRLMRYWKKSIYRYRKKISTI